ncbi:hypothetical protein J6590_029026 [Homalodisca vitripennis]|nr:hypothetical protein J6590_029026 [Homalodisca vitripennis]
MAYIVESTYRLQSYDLRKKSPINNIVRCEDITTSVPYYEPAINSHFVLYSIMDETEIGITFLYVRRLDGKLLTCFNRHMCFDWTDVSEYVIDCTYSQGFRIYMDVHIWTIRCQSEEPKLLTFDVEWPKPEMHTISTSLVLILSFKSCFKVIDIQKENCLYEVKINIHELKLNYANILVNDYYYILCQWTVNEDRTSRRCIENAQIEDHEKAVLDEAVASPTGNYRHSFAVKSLTPSCAAAVMSFDKSRSERKLPFHEALWQLVLCFCQDINQSPASSNCLGPVLILVLPKQTLYPGMSTLPIVSVRVIMVLAPGA